MVKGKRYFFHNKTQHVNYKCYYIYMYYIQGIHTVSATVPNHGMYFKLPLRYDYINVRIPTEI